MFVSYTEAIPFLFPSAKTGYSRATPVNTPTPGSISTDKTMQAVKSSDKQEATATVIASSIAPTTEAAPETSAVAIDGWYYFPF